MRAVLWYFVWSIAVVAPFWAACLDAEEPPAHRGLYAIWAPHDVLDLPYITGGQVVVQWADLEPVEGTYLQGDYNFLMERLPDDSTERPLVGPEQQRFGVWARAIPARATMRLRPDREFVQSLTGGPGQLRIVYLDSGTDSLTLSLANLSWQIARKDTGHWREHIAPIKRFPRIADGQSVEVSLRAGATEAILHMVELARGNKTP